MKKTTVLMLATGALFLAILPANAQTKAATTPPVKKEAQKIQGNNSTTTPVVTTAPAVNPAQPAGQSVQQPALPQIPLTCTWDMTDYDFGKNVIQMKPASATFTLTNKGKDPVTITQVSTTCGCTSPKYTKEPIKPGATGEVTLTFNAAVSGVFYKSATVTLNDGQKYPLTIKGDVQKVEQPKTTTPATK